MIGPQGPLIKIDFTDLANLCCQMPQRLLVTGILVQWLQWHFTDPINIDNQFLQDDLWTNDITTTKIVIDSVYKYNPAETEERPGIFIAPGAWKILQRGIDNRKMMTYGPQSDVPAIYNTYYQGSHTVFCIGGESAEVEILANEVYHELMEFAPIARKIFQFLRIVVSDVGEISILEEDKQHFVVPIVISYSGQDVWEIDEEPGELDNFDPKVLAMLKQVERKRK